MKIIDILQLLLVAAFAVMTSGFELTTRKPIAHKPNRVATDDAGRWSRSNSLTMDMQNLNVITEAIIDEFEAQHPKLRRSKVHNGKRLNNLKRSKRSTSCFTHEKILKFRKAFEKTFNSRMTYKQMKQLIDNHSICMRGICIACGENYVYSFEAKHR